MDNSRHNLDIAVVIGSDWRTFFENEIIVQAILNTYARMTERLSKVIKYDGE